MKYHKILKETNNSAIYKKAYRKILFKYEGVCFFCAPHSGCNSYSKYRNNTNWKRYRKTQYK